MIDSIGKYSVLGTLGKGAHSTIQHIRRFADGRQYALKVVPVDTKEDQKFYDQAKHEFRVAQLLDHPHLIKIHRLETEADWLFRVKKAFLLIEYVNGKTLDNLIQQLTLIQAIQIFHRVADALVHCHHKGVCHADLKPNNIMVGKSGMVKIIDYGLAWIKGEPKGRVQGTPEYMAPETARSQIVNEKSDIYNLGATMYRIVTGEKPPQVMTEGDNMLLDGSTFQHLLKSVRECNPKAPPELADLIDRCLSFNPPARPNRMSEVQSVLDVLVEKYVKKPEHKLEAIQMESPD
jgi:eukaryotic-like serine/threonine-protein kinase